MIYCRFAQEDRVGDVWMMERKRRRAKEVVQMIECRSMQWYRVGEDVQMIGSCKGVCVRVCVCVHVGVCVDDDSEFSQQNRVGHGDVYDIYVYIHIHMYAYVDAHICICSYTHVCIYTCICIFIHACMYIYTYTPQDRVGDGEMIGSCTGVCVCACMYV